MPDFRHYPVAPWGIGSEFPEAERPPSYASQLLNRFISPGGGAEKRRGIVTAAVVASAEFNAVHEMIEAGGTANMLISGMLQSTSAGTIWGLDTSAGNTLTQLHTGLDASARYRSAQMDDKLILVNGVDRNLYTEDVSAFTELRAVIEQGEIASTSGEDATHAIDDSNVTDWIAGTNVQVNDLVRNATLSAFAIVTEVDATVVRTSPVSANVGGIGSAPSDQEAGDRYEIIDLVELNVVPVLSQDPDNIAVAGPGSSATRTQVSSPALGGLVDFSLTEMKTGDYIRNTTQNRVAQITGISGNEIQHTDFDPGDSGSHASGDSLLFFKSAMPLADDIHVQYGRAYMRDSRDRRKLRISGPNDPQDMTTDAGTLDSATFEVGSQQSEADEIVGIAGFQQYTVICGRNNTWLFSGTDPIADTSADAISFAPTSLFPQGIISPDSVMTVGNDGIIFTPDGLQSFALEGSETLPTREILSEALRDEIQTKVSGVPEKSVKILNYPKQSWVMAKVSSDLYIFNYSPNLRALALQEAEITQPGQRGSWSLFTGPFAEQESYLVRSDGRLWTVDASGHAFRYDDVGQYTDGGTTYQTRYQTAWLGLDESRGRGAPTRRQKAGTAILPEIQTSANITYTVRATAAWNAESSDSADFTVSGQDNDVTITPRVPLRWRGERVRLTFETNDANGPDILQGYTIRYNRFGVL